ncbi:acyl-CoA dehydrogenase family protein [Streptomyces sp. NPDC005474]|uniref:acyl-CoA dehydrogenase family protein n=1 Tax=Streptomyces sp. NPDC005474 TaxID=3154878 RepID=UPI0034541327
MSAPSTPRALDTFLTPRHQALWGDVDAFADQEIRPLVTRMEAAPGRVDRKVARLLATRGWYGVTVPRASGGMQAGNVAKTVLVHRLARVSGAAAAILQAGLIPVAALLHFGDKRQRTNLLPAVSEGRVLLSIAVTEPDQGGHIGGMTTAAEWDGKAWVLTGAKAHIGNSHIADLHIVVARTAPPGTRTSQALTAFLVADDRRGVTRDRYASAFGLHGFSFGRIGFDRVRISPEDVLGEVGQGFAVAQSSSILYGRPNLAAVSLGLHEAAFDATTQYVDHRPRYQGMLSDIGVVRDRLGAMAARLHMARILTYHAVDMLDQGVPCDDQLIAAKTISHEAAVDSGRDAMELHGASALANSGQIARVWRDMQTTYAPAGTGEVQRLRLAQAALREQRPRPTPDDEIDHIPWSVYFADRLRHVEPDPTAV